MLPRKCLTSCEVPYLCAIACPLNNRLDAPEFTLEPVNDEEWDTDEPLSIVVADEKTKSE